LKILIFRLAQKICYLNILSYLHFFEIQDDQNQRVPKDSDDSNRYKTWNDCWFVARMQHVIPPPDEIFTILNFLIRILQKIKQPKRNPQKRNNSCRANSINLDNYVLILEWLWIQNLVCLDQIILWQNLDFTTAKTKARGGIPMIARDI